MLAGTWGTYVNYNRLHEYGGQISGYITKKHFQTTADGSGKYNLDYWFVPAGGSKISLSSIIIKQQWDMLKVGDSLEIRYDQSNPNRNIPMFEGSPSLVLAFIMLVLGAVFMFFGGSRIFNSIHRRKTCA